MIPEELPACRHRGNQFYPGRWSCGSPRIVAMKGVTADLCGHVCPYVDHESQQTLETTRATEGTGYGIAIGTFDSMHSSKRRYGTEAVELNLAVLRANCGNEIKILVCDDASPRKSQQRYRDICRNYGAEFTTNQRRMGHSAGDMVVYYKAILWAKQNGLSTVTKLSHRMLIDVPNWVQDDSQLLIDSGFSAQTQMLANFGLEQVRTECVMMVVDRWHSPEIIDHYHPRPMPEWNETRTFEAIARFLGRNTPYPHFLPWRRLSFHRGHDRPPVYFRDMAGDADAEFRALALRHGVKLTDGFSTNDSCQSSDYQ